MALMAPLAMPDSLVMQQPERSPVGAAEFRSAMAAMAATVCVATARLGDEAVGRTVTSVLSLAIDPPSVLVSIDQGSRLAEIIAQSKSFSLAMLAQGQDEVAEAFAGRLEVADRFTIGDWAEWPSGQPMLLGAVTTLDCEVVGTIQTASHFLFAGAIVDIDTTTSRQPLIWQRHAYHALGLHD